jgi:hypothetical protein
VEAVRRRGRGLHRRRLRPERDRRGRGVARRGRGRMAPGVRRLGGGRGAGGGGGRRGLVSGRGGAGSARWRWAPAGFAGRRPHGRGGGLACGGGPRGRSVRVLHRLRDRGGFGGIGLDRIASETGTDRETSECDNEAKRSEAAEEATGLMTRRTRGTNALALKVCIHNFT